MTDGFVVLDRPAANLKGSWRRVHGTSPLTLGTELMIAEELQLGFQGLLDGPLDDGLTDINGQGFDGIEIDVEPRPFVPVSTAGDNFSPAVRHVANVRQILRLSFAEWHRVFVLELGEKGKLEKSA